MDNAAGQKPKPKQGLLPTLHRWWNKQDALDKCEATTNAIGFNDNEKSRDNIIELMADAGYKFTPRGARGDHLVKRCYSSRYVDEESS